ncbi:MAG: ubiquitin-like protein Pup [Actinomycetota bacterium]
MATRIRQEQHQHRKERDDAPAPEAGSTAGAADVLKHDLDDLLDETDEVLEENAEEFVASYVQKGGQ